MASPQKLNSEQSHALKIMNSDANVFLTGAAGTGKSFLTKAYLRSKDYDIPVVASTGAAAVLVHGCTFHSFFGLGILKGGIEKTIERALKDRRVRDRLEDTSEIVIDEISMIDPEAFFAADQIARLILEPSLPFGGIRLIVVGDFFQLPPVLKNDINYWLFQTRLWQELNFQIINLETIMRTDDKDFIKALNFIRLGDCPQHVDHFFSELNGGSANNFEGTVLFGHKRKVENFNLKKLNALKGKERSYPTEFLIKKGSRLQVDRLLKVSPLPEEICLKEKALIMIRKNHPLGLYVNGTLGHIEKMDDEEVSIKTLSGRNIQFTKESFEVLNADGEVEATIKNFPLTLAWASTIHKAQGASIDRILVDMSGIWEKGQAYVALSRAKSLDGLFLKNWDPRYIKSDPRVKSFYASFEKDTKSTEDLSI